MEIRKTERGFKIGEFTDLDGKPCSLQESSLATEAAVWFGVQDATPMCNGKPVEFPKNTLFTSRMHLTTRLVRMILRRFKKFVADESFKELHGKQDRYASPFSMYKDKTDGTLWLGCDNANPQALACDIYNHYKDQQEELDKFGINEFSLGWRELPYPKDTTFSVSMHLNKEIVEELIPYLTKFADTGALR